MDLQETPACTSCGPSMSKGLKEGPSGLCRYIGTTYGVYRGSIWVISGNTMKGPLLVVPPYTPFLWDLSGLVSSP